MRRINTYYNKRKGKVGTKWACFVRDQNPGAFEPSHAVCPENKAFDKKKQSIHVRK